MNQPSHDDAYLSAMNAAIGNLGLINEEAKRVSNRMDQLDSVLEALKPFMCTSEQAAVEDRHLGCESIEATAEPLHPIELAPQMVAIAIPPVVPQKMIESADPIQRRINSVLGLAVA